MECRLKAKKCGGCPMLGLDYAEQLKQKEAAVRKLVGGNMARWLPSGARKTPAITAIR